jgi:5-methylcytosine-specific restriction protein A
MARSVRYEFGKQVRRDANARSEGRCEAVGTVYGLEPGQRCNAVFKGRAKEFDHYPVPATEKGSDTLENCVVCCPKCHRHKTATFDIPGQAAAKRISDKHQGISRPKHQWSTQRLGSGNHQRRASSPIAPKFEGDVLARKALS